MDKRGSKAFQIHFKRLSSTALSLFEVKTSPVWSFHFMIDSWRKKKALKLDFCGPMIHPFQLAKNKPL